MSIEGQGHFFTICFQVLYLLYFTRPRYQVSVYRTTGPLVYPTFYILAGNDVMHENSEEFEIWPDLTEELAAL